MPAPDGRRNSSIEIRPWKVKDMKPELREIFTRYDAVIFDMDGTLVDSMWVWEEIDRDFFHSRGM